MTKPLALVCYEKLLPGSQLVNRLQDLGYRTHVVSGLAEVAAVSVAERPMVAVFDLLWRDGDIFAAIQSLRSSADTQHIPVIAFAEPKKKKLHSAAVAAGATLVASEEAVLAQLPQLLEQALEVR